MRSVADVIRLAKEKLTDLVLQARSGTLPRQPGQSVAQSLEFLINDCLSQARSKASSAVKVVLPESANAVVAMVAAGSKGGDNNIAQILACVAQQNVDAQRIPNGFKDRTLPHFCKFDIGPQAKGFVENSYLKGLTPTEFFFHMMGGRGASLQAGARIGGHVAARGTPVSTPFLPCSGSHRHCRQDRRDGLHAAPSSQGHGGSHGSL